MNLNRKQWANVRRAINAGRRATKAEFIEALQDIDELFADLEAANTSAILKSDEIREIRQQFGARVEGASL